MHTAFLFSGQIHILPTFAISEIKITVYVVKNVSAHDKLAAGFVPKIHP
jgi:hypothetical protein